MAREQRVEPAYAGPKWEYQTVIIRGDIVAMMNKAGQDGWEVVVAIGDGESTTPDGQKLTGTVWLLKRQARLVEVARPNLM